MIPNNSFFKQIRLFYTRVVQSLPFKILVAILVLSFLEILAKSNFFLIAGIRCKTQYGPCSQKDENALVEFKGQNLFLVDGNKIKAKLGQDFTNREVLVQRVFPNNIVVVLEKRKDIVSLKLDVSPGGVFLVDGDGIVTGFAQHSFLPTLTLSRDVDHLIVGKSVNQSTKQAINIYSDVVKLQKVLLASLDSDKFTVVLWDNTVVYFSTDRDPKALVGAFQLILSRSKIDNKLPKSIDLRYSNPVLRY